MSDLETPLIKLQDLSNFLERGDLNDNLAQLAEMTATILNATNCSIMLLNEDISNSFRMSVCASHGPISAAAYKEFTGKGEGITGHVIATGKALLIEDIHNSKFAKFARRAGEPGKSLISSPITINGKIVGVVNISGHTHNRPFSSTDLSLLNVIALFIGKSIQTIQLQRILNSRFAQLALAQEAQSNIGTSLESVLHHPDKMAKILAKSFYKEMIRGGFGSNQIISAASEIINQLNNHLQQHSNRMNREIVKRSDNTLPSTKNHP